MPYRHIPGHDRTTPLKHWLRENLPSERPPHGKLQTWALVVAYVAGRSVRELAAETGVPSDGITMRIGYLAKKLGYQSPEVQRWVLPDGTVAPHAIDVDLDTGCWLWRGPFKESNAGPSATLPEAFRPAGSTAVYLRQPVRRFLWEREHEPVPRNRFLTATCGRPACVNPAHAALRTVGENRSEQHRDDLLARKDEETVKEAAARLGFTMGTIRKVRGNGGKKPELSKLRPWLQVNLPAQQPASVIEQDWLFARRYVEGETLATLGAEAGVSRQMVQFRIKRLATMLGWVEPQRRVETD